MANAEPRFLSPYSARLRLPARRNPLHSARLLSSALASMDQGVIVYCADLRIAYLNTRARTVLDLPADILHVGASFAHVHDALRVRGGLTHLAQAVRTPLDDCRLDLLPPSFEWERPDGRAVDVRSAPLSGGGFVLTFTEITQRRRIEERVRYIATHDDLTGLANRALFRKRLAAALSRSAPVAILMCDLDRFKAVNDSYGHPVGDALLRLVAERMSALMRSEDTIARLGGDEFAIILTPVADAHEVDTAARRLIAAVNEPSPIAGHRVEVGLSVGSLLVDGDDRPADELFKLADMALYEAKAAGRNTHREFDARSGARATAHGQLALAMKEAMRREEFRVVYQPIVQAATGEVVSFEALLRWEHPSLGPIAPTVFVPIAEETGQIGPLGAWVLRTACRQAVTWPENVVVGVNVSAVQLTRQEYEGEALSALSESGLSPRCLKLEVTESVLVQDSALACLHRLRSVGIRIALDDFGTGYSSLSYLRRFPFDKIKLDRSFIRDIADPDAAAIVRAVVGIGERLGMRVVAEGVETAEQLDLVRREGCAEIQGYYFSPPLEAEAVPHYLRANQARGWL